MSTMPVDDIQPPCGVCKGKYSEHFDKDGKKITQHAYTELEGDLVTHTEAAKRKVAQARQVMPPPGMVAQLASANPLAMGRLVEVLIAKSALTAEEALYIAGYAEKPAQPSGYRDPATVVEVKR